MNTTLAYDMPPTAGGEMIRAHYQSIPVAVLIPGLQATITGTLLGITITSLAWLVEYDRPIALGVVVATSCQTTTWLLLLVKWSSLIQRLEKALGIDIDMDGKIGDKPEPRTIRVEVVQDEGRKVQFADFCIEESKLERLGSGILSGKGFSESQWTGSGAIFSRSEFHKIRDTFISRGWLEWKNPDAPAQGLSLTRPGHAVIRHFANLSATPYPTLGSSERKQRA